MRSIPLCIGLFATSFVHAQSVTVHVVEDTEFADADWTFETFTLGNGGTSIAAQAAAGGNPGAYRRCTREFGPYTSGNAPHLISQFHYPVGAEIDPAVDGAIQSVAIRFDYTAFSADTNLAIATVAEQDGRLYWAGYDPDVPSAEVYLNWLTYEAPGWTGADFDADPFGGSGMGPDFSDAGSPVRFGYFTGNTQSPTFMPATGYSVIDGFDNFRLEVTTVRAGCVPADLAEPFGLLDLADINAFISGFVAMDPIADLNADGLFDLADISLFVSSFLAGCG